MLLCTRVDFPENRRYQETKENHCLFLFINIAKNNMIYPKRNIYTLKGLMCSYRITAVANCRISG